MNGLLLAGFDAGQTQTRCRLSRWHQNQWLPIAEGLGSGVIHLHASDGKERFEKALRSSFSKAVGNAGLRSEKALISAAAVGASGIEHDTPLQEQAQHLLARCLNIPSNQCLATGDERTALHGAFPQDAGIVLISGTGMICIGRNDQGKEQRCGGWGWLLDEGGSAQNLGQKGLQLSLRMADGRIPDRPLREKLWRALNCSSAAAIKALVVQPSFGAAGFAQLAPLVVAEAQVGDKDAIAILEQSADCIAEAIAGVAQSLELSAPKICGNGGAFEHLQPFRELIEQAIAKRLSTASWIKGQGDALDGALQLALRQLKRNPD